MQLKTLLAEINLCFPFNTALEGDKIGLQIQTENQIVTGILFTLEVTDEVVAECISKKFNTIVAFHPLIYYKLSEISFSERVGRLCSRLIKHSINLIVLHTTFDVYEFGTSRILSDYLGLKWETFLVPNKIRLNCGMGAISVPLNKVTTLDLVSKINNICNLPVKYCGNDNKELKKIAIVGGSGTSFIPEVIANNCDCFITADISYHQFHSAKDNFILIDAGHYEMEQFVPFGISNVLNNFLTKSGINFSVSEIVTNPIKYYTN